MKIEHLTNGFVKIATELSGQLATCEEFSIATAFIGSAAIDLIEQCLKKNNKLKNGQLLLGVYGYFNLKSDFIRLKILAKTYPDKFKVHISKDKSFHWKFYQFKRQSNNVIYIGSANFTNGGMGNNAELLIKVTASAKVDNGPFEKIKLSFDQQFEKNSGPISKFPIDFYPIVKRESSPSKLSKIFNDFFIKDVETSIQENGKNENAVIIFLTDDAKTTTYKKIFGYNPAWEKNNFDFFVCNTKSIFKYCLSSKKILLISKIGRNKFNYCWVALIDKCDEVKTADGKYFIAYKIVGKDKILTIKQQEKLFNDFDIKIKGFKNLFEGKVLRKNQVKQMESLLE